jgi:hypothetical protein
VSKTEIELRQAAIWLLQRQAEAGFTTEREAAIRLLKAIEASQSAEQRDQEEEGFAA